VDPAGDGKRRVQRREAYRYRAQEQKQSKLNPSPTVEYFVYKLCDCAYRMMLDFSNKITVFFPLCLFIRLWWFSYQLLLHQF